MYAARLTFIAPAAQLAFVTPNTIVPTLSSRRTSTLNPRCHTRQATFVIRRYQTVACDQESSVSSDATSSGRNRINPDRVSGTAASRSLLGRVLVEVLSLIVGAALLLVVVIWRASQVVSTAAWRAVVWLSNVRRLGKWACAKAFRRRPPVVTVLREARDAVTGLFIRTTEVAREEVEEQVEKRGELDVVEREMGDVQDVHFGDFGAEVVGRRRLVLVRHAKTEWERHSETADHERGLSTRGQEEARVIGAALITKGWVPHRVLCSDAVRTVQTLSLLNVPEREGQEETLCTESLYYAVTGEEMAVAVDEALGERGFADKMTLMVVCHNPGCEELVEELTGHRLEMGTGCAALLEFDGEEEKGEEGVFRLLPRRQGWELVDVLKPGVLAGMTHGP